MYLGVVANPVRDKNFNGKIYLKRVSKTVKYKQGAHNQNFTDEAGANGLLKRNAWRDPDTGLVVEGMTLEELRESIAETFDLTDDIKERLVLRWKRQQSDTSYRYIDRESQKIPCLDTLTRSNVELVVRFEKGDERTEDVSCDSAFMEKVMPEVGKAIRDAYHWVHEDVPIFLFLDNAGGHGTQEVVDAYVKMLEDEHNVVCIHQRPRSPCTNMLDLGVWMAFQNVVEKMHFRKRKHVEALCRTVEESWTKLEDVKLENVYKRWLKVLELIIEDEGGDRLVEKRRGKLYREPSATAENLDDDAPPSQAGNDDESAAVVSSDEGGDDDDDSGPSEEEIDALDQIIEDVDDE